MNEFPAHPQNYGSRYGNRPEFIVLHTTEPAPGTPADLADESAEHWFANHASHASAHYVIAQDGETTRCVDEGFSAWHAGNAYVNRRSVGIELAGRCENPAMFTAAMLLALRDLCLDVARRHGVPLDRQHIIGHAEVPDPKHPGMFGGVHHHTDPGLYFPWEAFMRDLLAAVDIA